MSLRSGVVFVVSLGLGIGAGVGTGLLGFGAEFELLKDIPEGNELGTDDGAIALGMDDAVDMEAMGRIETPEDDAGGGLNDAGEGLNIGAPSASKFEVR